MQEAWGWCPRSCTPTSPSHTAWGLARPRSSSLKVLLRLLLLFNGPLSLFLKTFASGLNCGMQDLFSFSEACGIIVPQPGIEPTFPALQGRFLTTGPAGKSLYMSFLHLLLVQRPI